MTAFSHTVSYKSTSSDTSQAGRFHRVASGWSTMLAIRVFGVLYQRAFGYSHGLDSITPNIESLWKELWRFNSVWMGL